MMKIAIDISPLQTGHKVRGVGFYLEHLKNALTTYYPENNYFFFSGNEKLPQADLIHYPYFEPFFITLPFFQKQKRVITVHDLTPLIFPSHFPAGIKGNLAWQIQKINLQMSQAIITDSDSSKKDIMKYTGISSSKIHTVYLAAGEEFKEISADKAKTELKKYNLPEKFILYVGDVTWNKNLPRLVKAVKQLNIPLVMVGKSLAHHDFDKTNVWNKDLVEVQEMIKDDKNFVVLGFVPTEDLIALYNTAQVFVFPSLYEGFGLPVLEAMQSGCPVITTQEGSLSEIAGEAAYFVDAYSEQSIKEGIEKVVNTKKLQEELREKGFGQAKKFTWKETAKKTVEVYSILKIN